MSRVLRSGSDILTIAAYLAGSGIDLDAEVGRACRGLGKIYGNAQYFSVDQWKERKREQGRNQLCQCGSGRKYKHCCIGKESK